MIMTQNKENHKKTAPPKIVSNFWSAVQDEDFLFILKMLGLI